MPGLSCELGARGARPSSTGLRLWQRRSVRTCADRTRILLPRLAKLRTPRFLGQVGRRLPPRTLPIYPDHSEVNCPMSKRLLPSILLAAVAAHAAGTRLLRTPT